MYSKSTGHGVHKGRGAGSNRSSRYLPYAVEKVQGPEAIAEDSPVTECRRETVSSIISTNQSPDIPFEQSINPYRGCEHGCIYCYARPTHAWLDLSPGLDFETRLSYKHNAAEKLEESFRKPSYRCKPITIGANTDPYQPIEKQYGITRSLLEVCQRYRHPVSLITKGALVERDIDILSAMAADGLAAVAVSITTLDTVLKRNMEPRAASAAARFHSIERLSKAGIPVTLLFAPVIPALNDRDMESIVQQAAAAGARSAAYMLLRLPLEIRDLFHEWLHEHYPLRAQHVISLIQQCRDGKDNDSQFGQRMRGTGPFAELLAQRFIRVCREQGLNQGEIKADNCRLFKVPSATGDQLRLF